jgi:tetraprenyl-beta-curcumene synthase
MSAATAITFMRAAPTYWGSVYPRVRREIECQRQRAVAIPDPELRRIALSVLHTKRANIDGAAAFAAFVPRRHRAAVIRAQVAFQSLYDYLDVLTERPHDDPVRNSRQLHGALTAALDPSAQGGDYRAHQAANEDGGYLQDTVERCQAALSALPGYAAVQPSAARLGAHIVEYQSFNVTDASGPREALAQWAGERKPRGSDLRWWETAAAAGSSLGLFALIAMAAQRRPSADEALAVENAYFPWVGALHSLLDSLIDLDEDRESGQPALIAHYGAAEGATAGLRRLAEESRRRVATLPHADRHALMLASMAAIYLVEPRAGDPHACAARGAVLSALGTQAVATMAVMRLRRLALSARPNA